MVDNMTRSQRSRTMSRIRSKDTLAERALRSAIFQLGLRFRIHYSGLQGRPDIVFPRAKVAVFVDGDFWHGWKFDEWKHKLAPYWRLKIEGNLLRDQYNSKLLKKSGWRVIRVWEHEIEHSATSCAQRVAGAVQRRSTTSPRRRPRSQNTP
jgi:DNA mismatch endonuclease, patch repair protein